MLPATVNDAEPFSKALVTLLGLVTTVGVAAPYLITTIPLPPSLEGEVWSITAPPPPPVPLVPDPLVAPPPPEPAVPDRAPELNPQPAPPPPTVNPKREIPEPPAPPAPVVVVVSVPPAPPPPPPARIPELLLNPEVPALP